MDKKEFKAILYSPLPFLLIIGCMFACIALPYALGLDATACEQWRRWSGFGVIVAGIVLVIIASIVGLPDEDTAAEKGIENEFML